MSLINNICIGRQPIFNKNMRVYGYELLFRSAATDTTANIVDDSKATAQVVANLLSDFGLNKIVGDKKAFINFNAELLSKNTQVLLPKRQVVIEVLETVEPTLEVLAQLKDLSKKGYRIALDDYDFSDKLRPFEDFTDIIKIDILAAGPQHIIKNLPRLKLKNKRLLAEKIETKAQFEFCQKMGFDFFQGYFFAKPTVIEGKALDNNQASILRFLSMVFDPMIDMRKISSVISNDISMSQKLVKIASSSADGDNIKSIHDVVLRFGLNRLQSWAGILALNNASDKPSELLTTSLIRAKFCELVGEKDKDFSKDSYFIVGLFSSLDAVMDQTLESVLADLSFNVDIKKALLEQTGSLGKTLKLVKEIEAGSTNFKSSAGLNPTELSKMYMQAMEFANGLDI